ncbi:MFS transporter [Bacillus mesophilum]|uniref:MFS transporter n=1 Tax=Bacillus mesophilum TaxID=1071718 RepID=A0A7V7RQ50_9BACI|nr:MFS transporter [Bacillus mesophilum]KAB2335498.1 MFS transporter [Bacillus mesophilum]
MGRLQVVGLLLIVTGVFVASNIYTLIPIYSEIAHGIHASEEQIIWGSSIFTVCYAFGLLLFGPLSEQYGRKKVIVSGLLMSGLSTLLVGLSFNIESLFIFRGVQGFFLGSFAPVAFAYIFELYSDEKQRTLILSLINCGFLVAGIFGQIVSSALTLFYGWEIVFYVFAFFYIALFAISNKIHIKTAVYPGQGFHIFKVLTIPFLNKQLFNSYLITFTLLLSFIAFYDSLGRMLSADGFTDEELIIIRTIGLVGTILAVFTGKIIEKLRLKMTMIVGILLCLSCLLLFTLFSEYPVMITVLSIPFVASIALLIPSVISFIGSAAKTQRGLATSFYSFSLLIGASLGPVLAAHLSFTFVITVLLVFFCCNLFLVLKM